MNKEKRIGIIMHGVTGRMGMNQHLIRSILEIRKQGGVALKDGTRVMPDPLLVGRNAAKVEELARKHGVARWTTDLDAALASKEDTVFFDAASTQLRPTLLKQAIKAGKHVYCEKPVATTLAEAMRPPSRTAVVLPDPLSPTSMDRVSDVSLSASFRIPYGERWTRSTKIARAANCDARSSISSIATSAMSRYVIPADRVRSSSLARSAANVSARQPGCPRKRVIWGTTL